METSTPAARVQDGKIAKTAAYYTAFIALGLTVAVFGPTLAGLARHTGVTIRQISVIFTAQALGYLLGSMFGGRLYDRLAGHRVQAAGLLLMAAMFALAPVASRLWLLVALLTVLGFGQGTLDVGGNTLIVWVHREKVGPFMQGLHFFYGIGTFLCPLLVAQVLLASSDINWAYWISALILVPLAVWLWLLPSPPIQTGERAGHDGKVNVGVLALLMVFFFLIVGAEGSFGSWIASYITKQGLGVETTAAYMTSAYWGAFTVARLINIPLAAWLHPRWILLGDLLLCALGMAAVLIWPLSFAAVLASCVGFGIGIASIFPTAITLAERYLPINGKITGFFFVGSSAGSMFFPWLIGQMFEPRGPLSAMWVITIAILLSLGVFAMLLIGYRQESQPVAK